MKESANPKLFSLTLSAIGVVFGDIGTSPLYAVKEVFHAGLSTEPSHVLGVLSLIFWSLTLVVTSKYALYIMRADNEGEGGIMSLLALSLKTVQDPKSSKARFILTAGLIGTVLFYGDSIITPAISVLSAVEGLSVIAPSLETYVHPLTYAVLGAFFIIQSRGTEAVGRLFAPVMCIWFIVLMLLGIINIVEHPEVLVALNPLYGIHLLVTEGWVGLLIMGSVVLTITGAEALYADMGHFGLKPIRFAWFGFVFPALVINYFGQGALLISDPAAIENPFYRLAPQWALPPLLVLSTLATIIASQAVVSGAFSLTRQAIQLGYTPRMSIRHTSSDEIGQIYIPLVNWLLMVSVFILVMSFETSGALASAYGLAVTGTMLITTILAYLVFEHLWKWPAWICRAFLLFFLILDSLYLFANTLKIPEGGWLPLFVGGVIFFIMTTWIKGRELMVQYAHERRVMFEDLEERFKDHPPSRVEGTAIYMAKSLHGVPQVLLSNLEHYHALHEKLIVLTIVTQDKPYVDQAHRIKIRTFGRNEEFIRVKMYFGFHETQDVRTALRLLSKEGIQVDQSMVTFFVGTERVGFRRRSLMPKWRRELFQFLYHNSLNTADYFRLPLEKVVEIGVRLEL